MRPRNGPAKRIGESFFLQPHITQSVNLPYSTLSGQGVQILLQAVLKYDELLHKKRFEK
jgi:hypothetical protein